LTPGPHDAGGGVRRKSVWPASLAVSNAAVITATDGLPSEAGCAGDRKRSPTTLGQLGQPGSSTLQGPSLLREDWPGGTSRLAAEPPGCTPERSKQA
jgi:hypothetical protein